MKNWFIRLWYGQDSVILLEVPHVCNMKYVRRREFPKGTVAQCPVCSQKWKVINIGYDDFMSYYYTKKWVRIDG